VGKLDGKVAVIRISPVVSLRRIPAVIGLRCMFRGVRCWRPFDTVVFRASPATVTLGLLYRCRNRHRTGGDSSACARRLWQLPSREMTAPYRAIRARNKGVAQSASGASKIAVKRCVQLWHTDCNNSAKRRPCLAQVFFHLPRIVNCPPRK
jgi:hypothetical protein